MVQRKTVGEKVFDFFVCALVVSASLVCLYPMLYVLFASISDPLQLVTHTGPILKPLGFSLVGYEVMLQNPNLPVGYGNTIFYVVVGTALKVLMTMLGAYALSCDGYRLKKVISIAIIITMYINGGLIPNFLLVKELGMLNTRFAILLPGLIGTWNMIVMRTAFKAVPSSIYESAKIDGANDFVILFKIVAPIAKATLMVIMLFYAVGIWNSWFDSMIYLQNARDKWPLQMFLREILIYSASAEEGAITDVNFVDEVMKYSMIIISTVPILCVYPFIQKHFNKGIMMGSLKG